MDGDFEISLAHLPICPSFGDKLETLQSVSVPPYNYGSIDSIQCQAKPHQLKRPSSKSSCDCFTNVVMPC